MNNSQDSLSDPILLSQRDAHGVVTLTLNRPDAFNALSEAMLAALKANHPHNGRSFTFD